MNRSIIAALLCQVATCRVRADVFGDYRLLGESVDDAAEAFDKTAKLLDLPIRAVRMWQLWLKQEIQIASIFPDLW